MTKIEKSPEITYLVYDKKTGRIVHRHRSFHIETEAYCECDPQEVKNLTSMDNFAMSKITDHDPKNLDVIMIRNLPEGFSPGISGFIVDTRSKKVLEKPKIKLSSENIKLEGDGKDSTVIEIKVVDEKGQAMKGYHGTVKVSTSRGKLSAKEGLVKIENGIGHITLISANETVDRVKITAQCPDGKCLKGGLDFEFV
jgi:hypothetical protein